ncbi:MAG: hemerythrin domain-containing protein [Candidatus Thermoplasmatota archaeon]
MKVEKIAETIKGFDDGDIEEEEAVKLLKDVESYDFSAAISHLQQDSRLEEGDLPSISKLFHEIYDEIFTELIRELEKDHPIRRLVNEHERFEILLKVVEDISKDIKEGSETEKIDKLETAVEGLSHLNWHFQKEEDLIFPAWHERDEWDSMVSYLLEDEHKDIAKAYERLSNKSKERKQDWSGKDWEELRELIEKLRGMIYFHTFHEGDIFYPIIVDQLPQTEFEKIEEKMDDIEKENTDIPLDEYISSLKDSIDEAKDRKEPFDGGSIYD